MESCADKKTLFLGLGIGRMTPEFIKIPFMNMTFHRENAKLALLNIGEPELPGETADKIIAVDSDLLKTLDALADMRKEASA